MTAAKDNYDDPSTSKYQLFLEKLFSTRDEDTNNIGIAL